jgi:hypothetical protein
MHLESNARNCDTRTTLCMSHTHRAHVPPDVASTAANAYARVNNNKKKNAYGVVEPNEGR